MQHQENKKVIYQTLVLRNLFLKKNLFIRSSSVVCITISLFSNTCKNKIQTHCFFYIPVQRKMWSKMWSKGDYIKKSNKFLHWTKWKLVLSFFIFPPFSCLAALGYLLLYFPPLPFPFCFPHYTGTHLIYLCLCQRVNALVSLAACLTTPTQPQRCGLTG